MPESSALPSLTPSRSRVVASLARAAERPCSRPGCPAPARATLTFSYATAQAFLDRLSEQPDPQRYDLCARHASRTEPPRGWGLLDRRPDEDRVDHEPVPPAARDLGGDATVAVLAAALRAVPEPVPLDLPPVAPRAERTLSAEPPRRRTVVDTIIGAAPDVDVRDTAAEVTLELPAVRATTPTSDAAPPAPTATVPPEPTTPAPLRRPRRVPAAGDRGPATDW